MAVESAGGNGWITVRSRRNHKPVVAAMVCGDGPRSIFSVRSEQCRQPRRFAQLSDTRGTDAAAATTKPTLGCWLSHACGSRRWLRCGRPLLRSGERKRRLAGSAYTDQLAPPAALGAARLCAVELDAQRDHIPLDGHRGGATAVGRAAVGVLADVHSRVRAPASAVASVDDSSAARVRAAADRGAGE